MYERVEFPSEGATLRGHVYLPPDASAPVPVVIMAHGFSATITGMVADRYAEALVAAGFAVLLYDHRNFGISDGEPRQEINKWVQARGYRDAIDFVGALPGIDASRIALWGDSLSGAEVVAVGAIDARVTAVVAQVPAFGDTPPPPDPDGQLFALIRETFLFGDVAGSPETTTGPMAVVSADQHAHPSLLAPVTAFRWFIEYGGRFGTRWENLASVVTAATPVPLNPILCAPHLEAALLLVIAVEDEMEGANSDMARLAWKAAPQPKQLVEVEGGHFGLLQHPGAAFDRAAAVQCAFLKEHLGGGNEGAGRH